MLKEIQKILLEDFSFFSVRYIRTTLPQAQQQAPKDPPTCAPAELHYGVIDVIFLLPQIFSSTSCKFWQDRLGLLVFL